MRFKVFQIALLTMIFLHGCSDRLPEKSINDFWNWFSTKYAAEHSTSMTVQENSEATAGEITRRLKTINKDLTWQFGKRDGIKRQLIISAGGIKQLFPVVTEVVKDAPELKYWSIIAFKPRLEKLEPIEIDGIMVSPEDIFFTAQPHDGVVDVSILLDHTIPLATAEKIAVMMLDQALGEYDAGTKIGSVTFGPITELNEDNSNFRELRKAVDDYCK